MVRNELRTLRADQWVLFGGLKCDCGHEAGVGIYFRDRYVQDKVRPGPGREGALGYERYFAIEHMDVRREASRRPHGRIYGDSRE